MFRNGRVLVCITAQDSCVDIINEGKKLAEKLNAVTEVVTVQPKKMSAVKRAETMKCLQELSKITDCPISIIYSDNVIKSLASYIEKAEPTHIFTGQQAENSELVFQLSLISNVPISMVSRQKTVYTLPIAIH